MDIIRKKAVLCLVLILCSLSANAQNFNQDAIRKRVAERVRLMNDYISYMANKKNNYDTRQYYRNKALPLFIGKGYSYVQDGVKREGVLMQTTSTNRPNQPANTQLMRVYFSRLIDLRYSDVVITSTKAENIKVSDLKKIGRNEEGNYIYECTCQYEQYFYGYRDGRLIYKDKTTKRISCQIELEETEDGMETVIRLGDVEAICTENV